jgi:uncharacterized membrane protein
MTVVGFFERNRAPIKETLEFVRTTVVGGALFLLPIIVVLFVLSKVFGLMGAFTEPVVRLMGVETVGGVAVSTLVTIFGIVLSAFLAGLFARTKAGQAALTWIQDGVSATLPQFSLIQGVARDVGAEGDHREMPVVMVPTDAGWALGLLLESEGDWHAVYLPGAPEMSSGSVAYAHKDQIHQTDLSLKQLWMLMRGRGKGSSAIYRRLATLQAEGRLGD